MSRLVRVAVIGAGNMGRHHVRNYSEMEGVELVAVADMNPEAETLATQYDTAYFSSHIKMLDETRPEAVSVVVPTPLHRQIGFDVMSRGIHCLIEKPIAASVREADELIEIARKHKVVFTVGHIERFNPVVRKLKELVDAGRVGDITSVVSKRVGGFPAIEPKTDVIIDLAVHDIDIINYLIGSQPTKITSHGSRTLHSREIDAAEVLLEYGGASGFIQANWVTPVKVRTISVTGTRGYLEGNYVTQELNFYAQHRPSETTGFADFQRQSQSEREVIDVDVQEPLSLELQAFLKAIQPAPTMRPEDARDALRIALEASRQNRL